MGGPGGWSTKRRPVEECFTQRYVVDPNGCWLWTGYVKSNGYGLFMVKHNQAANAHRWAYEHFVGPVPDGLALDHLCRVRRCVNPAHLEAVTQSVNIRRGLAARPPRTQCQRGHPWTADNIYVQPSTGGRACRTCIREGQRRWRESRERRAA